MLQPKRQVGRTCSDGFCHAYECESKMLSGSFDSSLVLKSKTITLGGYLLLEFRTLVMDY
jgi:hypothetical protein